MATQKYQTMSTEENFQDSYEAIKTSILNGEDPDEIGERVFWLGVKEERARLKAQEQNQK